MEDVDTLIEARWLIPVEPAGVALADHGVAVRGGKIVAVLPREEAAARFRAPQRVELSRHALIPGLVNLHTHAAMVLLRGLADDLPLRQWQKERIEPAENKHVSPGFVYDGTLLACAEMLRGGITCFNDMYFYPGDAARAALQCGMRAAIGLIVADSPTPYASDADDYLAKGLAVRDGFRQQPLLSFCMAPYAPSTASERTLRHVLTIADELELPIHIPLHETRDEIESSVRHFGARPMERLHALGAIGPRLIAVHAVHVNENELELLARYGCSVAHCPASNLKLASGADPVSRMLELGINVGLGTDGAASNNRLDLLGEMRLAALLAKGTSGNAASMPAHEALRAATLAGARALGLENSIGSITAGKFADLCAVSFDAPVSASSFDPAAQLVYSAGRENVTQVWVAGKLRVDHGYVIGLKDADLDKRALLWQNELVRETKA